MMNGAIARAIQFVLALVTGFGGLCVGAFLGAATGRFITGEQGLHGFDIITLACLGGGAMVGLFAGARIGSAIAKNWTRRGPHSKKT